MKKKKIFISFISVFISVAASFLIFVSPFDFADNDKTGVININYNTPYETPNDKRNIPFYNDDHTLNNSARMKEYVYIVGKPIGIKLYCDGVIVVGTEKIITEKGEVSPADIADIRCGDIIKSVNGIKITSNASFCEMVNKSNGEDMNMVLIRGGEEINRVFNTVLSSDGGRYKAGLWIRDSSAGIGIMTFITDNRHFSCLGHAVCDIDTDIVFPVADGNITDAEITGIIKGDRGTAGELSGTLEKESIGKIYENGSCGIYGTVGKDFDISNLKIFPVAKSDEVKVGKAQLITSLENGKTEYFDIEITKTDCKESESKNFIIKITDENLIGKTGGIVQGMSGSPVIQNGFLIGAVTHVFLNDPTGGYGIYAESMLEKTKEY